MSLDIGKLASKMEGVFLSLEKEKNNKSLELIRDGLRIKAIRMIKYLVRSKSDLIGNDSKVFYNELKVFDEKLKELRFNFYDKPSLVITGSDKSGKSTILRFLLGSKFKGDNINNTGVEIYSTLGIKNKVIVNSNNCIATENISRLNYSEIQNKEESELRYRIKTNELVRLYDIIDIKKSSKEIENIGGVIFVITAKEALECEGILSCKNNNNKLLDKSTNICVINKIDLLSKKERSKLYKMLRENKNNVFKTVICISGKKALEGVKNGSSKNIKVSGIRNLQKSINDIFIKEYKSIQLNSKIKQHENLKIKIVIKIDEFIGLIDEAKEKYINVESDLESFSSDLKGTIKNNLEKEIRENISDVENLDRMKSELVTLREDIKKEKEVKYLKDIM